MDILVIPAEEQNELISYAIKNSLKNDGSYNGEDCLPAYYAGIICVLEEKLYPVDVKTDIRAR